MNLMSYSEPIYHNNKLFERQPGHTDEPYLLEYVSRYQLTSLYCHDDLGI